MIFQLTGSGPLYERLARALRVAIRHGRLLPGQRLPSSREMATNLGISRNVVLLAFEHLKLEGYLHSQAGSGTYVTSQLPERLLQAARDSNHQVVGSPNNPELSAYARRAVATVKSNRVPALSSDRPRFDFKYGLSLPDVATLSRLRRLRPGVGETSTVQIEKKRELFNYGDEAGLVALRQQLADHLFRYRGIQADVDRIMITAGSQQALYLASRVLLDEGSCVAIEEPHYQGARNIFLAAGAKLDCIPVDDNGIQVDLLPSDKAVRMLYVTPSHQFPAGSVLPVERRLQLLEWARQRSVYVLEDDYDSEFRYDSRPLEALAALAPEQVIYCGTFAKSLFPSLRIGFLVLPQPLLESFRVCKWLTDRGNPSLPQQQLAEFMAAGDYERHLRRMARRYSGQRACVVECLERHFGEQAILSGSNAGVHIVVSFPGLDSEAGDYLIREAQKRNVGVYSIAPYYMNKPVGAGLMLGYANLDIPQIREGISLLAEAYRVVCSGPRTRKQISG